ncbi:hypothetical protein NPA08_00170 [Mycoplasmopsis citelli]|uniref:hypothetical protein n=1 Tax=Mycoplasmopsis citelli TaxID=171281 RepID=UPI0021153585|nr:hypothetical protein [Mycoplasmopsis citelli]UUD36245.1 hypothetical protein NPA08_00170 [Mycoplasmopsis citelli]
MNKTSTNKLKKTYSNKIAQLQNFLNFILVFFALFYIILNIVFFSLYGYLNNKLFESKKIEHSVSQSLFYTIYVFGSILALSLWARIIIFFVLLRKSYQIQIQKYKINISNLTFFKKLRLFLFSFSKSTLEKFCDKNKLKFKVLS